MQLPHSVVLGVQWGGPDWPLLLAVRGQNLGNQGGRVLPEKLPIRVAWGYLLHISLPYLPTFFKRMNEPECIVLCSIFFFFSYLFTNLAAPRGLSCGTWDLFHAERKLLVEAYGILFPNKGSNTGLLHWEREVLAIALDHQGNPTVHTQFSSQQSYIAGWWDINHSCVHRRNGSPGDLAKMTLCFPTRAYPPSHPHDR